MNQTSMIDQFTFPTVQFSLERKISRKISIAGEIGYQLYGFKSYGTDTAFINKKGFKCNVELRYYNLLSLFRHSRKGNSDLTGPYLGINFFYRKNRYNANINYTRPNDNAVYKDCFWVNKKNWGVHLVFGLQKSLSNHFVVDFYTGVGLMNRQSQNFKREYNFTTDSLVQSIDLTVRSMIDHASLRENNGVDWSFNLGIRLGIRF